MESQYKKVRNYLIAMDQKNLLGRGRIGEARRGYQQQQKRVLVFKIVALPISIRLEETLKSQQQLKEAGCLQEILPLAYSTSKCYIPYEFLPWTLADFKQTYLQNQGECRRLLEQLLHCYSYLYFMGVSHSNLKPSNILFDNKYKVVLADMLPTVDFAAATDADLMQLGILMYELLTGRTYGCNDTNEPATIKPSKLADSIHAMIEGETTWEDLFQEYSIANKFTQIKRMSHFHCHNRLVMLSRIASKMSRELEQHCYAKLSLYRLMERMLSEELKGKQENPSYRNLLDRELNKVCKLTTELPIGRLVGVRDLLGDPEHFGLNPRQSLCLLASLFSELDHAYLWNSISATLSAGQLQVMYSSYLRRLSLSELL